MNYSRGSCYRAERANAQKGCREVASPNAENNRGITGCSDCKSGFWHIQGEHTIYMHIPSHDKCCGICLDSCLQHGFNGFCLVVDLDCTERQNDASCRYDSNSVCSCGKRMSYQCHARFKLHILTGRKCAHIFIFFHIKIPKTHCLNLQIDAHLRTRPCDVYSPALPKQCTTSCFRLWPMPCPSAKK